MRLLQLRDSQRCIAVRHGKSCMALRHFVCKENRVEKRQEPLSLPLQMPVMLLNGELKAALLVLSSRSRSHLGPPVTGGATRCANWLASCVPAARKVTKSPRSFSTSSGVNVGINFCSTRGSLKRVVIGFSITLSCSSHRQKTSTTLL